MPELTLISLPYQRDSEQLIAKLAALPMPVIFDSGVSETGDVRYDILTALPCAYIKVTDGNFYSSDSDLEQAAATGKMDIFALLQNLLNKYKPAVEAIAEGNPAIPFCGGLAGYLGYPILKDCGEYTVNNAFFGIYNWALIQDHQSRKCYLLVQPGFPKQKLILIQDCLEGTKEKSGNGRLPGELAADMEIADYKQAFDRIKSYIIAGDCYQVNLAQRFSMAYFGDPLTAYMKLRSTANSPFSAYIHWGDGALLSVSPERFISHHQGRVLTQPIKGTRPRGETPEEDKRLALELINSEKDIAENLMIVDLLRNDLGKVCRVGSVKVERLFDLKSFINVHHLVSSISATLDERNTPLQLIKHCFPGGSITGAPKLRAMEIIEELEPHARDAYCGSVMYLDYSGNMDSNITIRTLLHRNNRLYCWAGGAIVDDSDHESEYRECFDKIASIRKAFGEKKSLLGP